jgi:uncharacterized protein YecE (DUF72 family)
MARTRDPLSQDTTSKASYIGTAGWSIASRYADTFTGTGSHLQRYAERLNAVEINSSFYKPHRRQTYERWCGSVSEGFRFSVKLPKAISHEHALKDCDHLIQQFAEQVTGLGEKLRVVLIQTPPKLPFDKQVFSQFLKMARVLPAAFVVEARHASWFTEDVDAFLRDCRVGRVAADPVKHGDGNPGGWRDIAYFRMHGSPRVYYSSYEAAALAALHDRMVRNEASETWCIFDNTASSAALGNALTLIGNDQRVG